MLCDICHKHPASVHLTEIVDDVMSEMHICEECARKKGTQMEQHFGLADLLGGLVDSEKPVEEITTPDVVCYSCGLTYSNFRKLGRMGCGDCYTSFEKQLSRLLKRIHGTDRHLGKVIVADASRKEQKEQLKALQESLQRAVELEEFEEAVRLRDAIRKLELERPAKPAAGKRKPSSSA